MTFQYGYPEQKQIITFRYTKRRKRDDLKSQRVLGDVIAEPQYTGKIGDLRATKGEENLFRAAYQSGLILSHWFRMVLGAPRGKYGSNELDFLFLTTSGEYVAIQVRDYDFIHHGEIAEAKDMMSDVFLLQELEKLGIVVRGNRIFSISDDDLENLLEARRIIEMLLM